MSLRLISRRSVLTSSRFLRANAGSIVACRLNSTATSTTTESAPVDPKITKIVDDISKLTLLETSSLIAELKTQLNIPDISFPAAGAFEGSGGGATGAAGGEEGAAQEEEKPEEKTIFSIKLESFDPKSKPKVIKEVKNLLSLSLVEAKKFVEAAPKLLKENVAKEDADKIKSTLEGLGAKVSLE